MTAEVTGTKSTNAEDLTETDKVRGDLSDSDTESSDSVESSGAAVKSDKEGSDSEPSDPGTDSSPSHSCHGETRQISGASAPERAGVSPDTGKVKPKPAIPKIKDIFLGLRGAEQPRSNMPSAKKDMFPGVGEGVTSVTNEMSWANVEIPETGNHASNALKRAGWDGRTPRKHEVFIVSKQLFP